MPSYLTSIVLQWSSDSLTESRITNPTFDTDITGWTETDSGGASLTPTHDSTVYRSGGGSMKLVQTAAGDDDHMSCTFAGTAGVTYQIRAWINVTAFTFGSTGLRAFGPGGTPNALTVISAVTDGWVQQEISLTPVTSGTVTVRLYGPQGTCYWDDVSVVAWTTVDNNEIRDIEWWAGIDREGSDPEPGGMTVTLKNKNRKWEPLFGSNLIDTQQRFRLTLNGVQEGVWFTESFDLDYPDGQSFSWVTIGCGDGHSILALDDLPVLDPPEAESYEDVVAFDEPWGYWQLGEPEGTRATAIMRKRFKGRGKRRRKMSARRGTRYTTAAEVASAAGPAGEYLNTPSLAQPGLILGATDTAVEFVSTGSEYVRIPVEQNTFFSRGLLSVECWVQITFDQTMWLIAGPFDTPTASAMFGFQRQSPADTVSFIVNIGGGASNFVASTTTLDVGDTHHIVGTFDSTNIKIYVDGVLEATGGTPGSPIEGDANEFVYIGQAGSAASFADAVIDEVAVYEYALSADRIMAHYQAGAERGYARQTAGERIAAIAESTLWSDTSIQTSGRDVLPIMHYGQGKLEELSEAAHAEGPRTVFFFNGAGNPVYLGHEWTATDANYNTVQWTFTDDGTGKPYQDVELEYDFETFNEVVASHESGESVLVTDTTESGQRGRRVNPEYTDVLLVEHIEVESLATHVLDYYKEPAKRPVSLTIDGHHCLAQILDLDIGHLIKVKKRGETGSATERVCHILAKRKSIDTSRHLTCTYTLSRGFDPNDGYWHLGYVGYSELGTTTIAAPA